MTHTRTTASDKAHWEESFSYKFNSCSDNQK